MGIIILIVALRLVASQVRHLAGINTCWVPSPCTDPKSQCPSAPERDLWLHTLTVLRRQLKDLLRNGVVGEFVNLSTLLNYPTERSEGKSAPHSLRLLAQLVKIQFSHHLPVAALARGALCRPPCSAVRIH